MPHSTRGKSATQSRRKKPAPKFPLWLHATGQWAKRIKGKFYYFGKNRDEALKEYTRVREYLERGDRPPPKDDQGLTLARLANVFLSAAKAKFRAGEMTNRTWEEYDRSCGRLIDHFGGGYPVTQLGPPSLLRYRQKLAETRNPTTLTSEVTRARVILSFAWKAGLVDKPVVFGEFKKPAKHILRKARQASGNASLTAWEIRRCINGAGPELRAMLLLGVNCGLGPADLGRLRVDHLDLDRGWLSFPRPKTSILRKARLWPETIRTLRWALRERPEPANESHQALVFLLPNGKPWSTGEKGDQTLCRRFRKLTNDIGITRKGVGFYGLRRSFRTAADAARDPVAVDLVMGHADHTMGGQYRQGIGDKRLTRVAKIVRNWLWGAE